MSIPLLRRGAIFAAVLFAAGCQVKTAEREPGVAGPVTVSPEAVEQAFDLGAYKGKVVLLDFWAPWSEPSRSGIPAMNKIKQDFADRGVEVVGLAVEQGPADRVASAAQELQIAYPVQRAGEKTMADFNVRVIPTKILIDRQGQVRKTYPGVVPPEEIRAMIIAMMGEPG